jgi:hypothetical protein
MKGIVVRNKLDDFLSNLKAMQRNAPQHFAEIVADRGVEIAKEEYAGTTATIEKQVNNDGTATITATGNGLFYDEYGTGESGRNANYGGKLEMDEPLKFVSTYQKNKPVSLNEWTYSYANKLFNKPTITGRPPKAQMFKTSQRLRKEFNKNKGD